MAEVPSNFFVRVHRRDVARWRRALLGATVIGATIAAAGTIAAVRALPGEDHWSVKHYVAAAAPTGFAVVQQARATTAPVTISADLDLSAFDAGDGSPARKCRCYWRLCHDDGTPVSWSETYVVPHTGEVRNLVADQVGWSASAVAWEEGSYVWQCQIENASGLRSAWVSATSPVAVAANDGETARRKLYVSGDGDDSHDGLTPATAKKTWAGVFAIAQEGDEIIAQDDTEIDTGSSYAINVGDLYVHRSGNGEDPPVCKDANSVGYAFYLRGHSSGDVNNFIVRGFRFDHTSVVHINVNRQYVGLAFIDTIIDGGQRAFQLAIDFEGFTMAVHGLLILRATQVSINSGELVALEDVNKAVVAGCDFDYGSSTEHCTRIFYGQGTDTSLTFTGCRFNQRANQKSSSRIYCKSRFYGHECWFGPEGWALGNDNNLGDQLHSDYVLDRCVIDLHDPVNGDTTPCVIEGGASEVVIRDCLLIRRDDGEGGIIRFEPSAGLPTNNVSILNCTFINYSENDGRILSQSGVGGTIEITGLEVKNNVFHAPNKSVYHRFWSTGVEHGWSWGGNVYDQHSGTYLILEADNPSVANPGTFHDWADYTDLEFVKDGEGSPLDDRGTFTVDPDTGEVDGADLSVGIPDVGSHVSLNGVRRPYGAETWTSGAYLEHAPPAGGGAAHRVRDRFGGRINMRPMSVR